MNQSFKIFSVAGIDIRLHITFPLILLWAAFQYGVGTGAGWTGAWFGLIVITLLFVLVTLHELGHSFAARAFGVDVKRIVLLPIGGVAQLAEIPDKPKQEFVIAIAGPAVNMVLAVLMGAVMWLADLPLLNPLSNIELTFTAVFSFVFIYNLLLAVFNLLPAFPMDGGRILRALLAMKLEYVRATTIAANVGRTLAVLFGLYGFFTGSFFTIILAIFVFTGASQELMLVRWRHSGLQLPMVLPQANAYTVQDVYSPQVAVLGPNDGLERALNLRQSGLQKDFPVAQNGGYLGFVTEAGLANAIRAYGTDVLVYAAMSPAVKPVTLATDLVGVLRHMDRLRVDALPVVEYGRLLGMITRRQIQTLFSRQMMPVMQTRSA